MYSIFKTFVLSLLMIAQVHFAYAQNASILPLAKTTFTTADGKPLTSGKVYFYIPGTSTLKTTWQDSAKTTPNTNPVILDGSGRALILGDGSYRQLVKDRLDNIIWDQVTSSIGSGGNGTTVGDGNAVGTILPWSGFIAPPGYVFAYGQEISRTTYSLYLSTVTQISTVTCTGGSPTLTAMTDTAQLNAGAAVESACLPISTTIIGKTPTSVTLNNNALVSTGSTATFYPYGNGNGVTTFNVPDLRGVVLAGRNNMGGAASSRLTSAFYTTLPDSIGANGGRQDHTMTLAELVSHNHGVALTDPGHTHTITPNNVITNGNGLQLSAGTGVQSSAISAASNTTGITISNGSGTPNVTANTGTTGAFSIIQPTQTTNYIVKVSPDSSIIVASGVASIGGMVGVLNCGSGITCSSNTISITAFPIPAPTAISLGGVLTKTCAASTWFSSLDGTGTFGCSQPNFTDLLGSIAIGQVPNNLITYAKIQQGTGLSLIGVTGNVAANNADIVAASDFQVMRRSGTNIAFGAINLASSNAVTGQLPNANLAQAAASTIKGNPTAALANVTDFTITGLTLKAAPVAGDEVLISDSAASNVFKKVTVASIASAGSVSSIAGNTGAFTLAYPLGNSTNDIRYIGPSDFGRLTYTSTVALAYLPYNGDIIRIAGTVFQIPAAGLAGLGAPTSVFLNGVAAQTLAINTTYYIYAFNNAGTVTADFSTTGHVTASTAGNIGTEIKSGDNTRTLLGMVRTGGTVIYASDLQTASWLNRRNKFATQSQSLAAASNTTAISFVTWSDESVAASHTGFMGGSAAAITTIQSRIDGGSSGPACQGTTTAGGQITMGCPFEYGLSEGNHTYDGTLSATSGTPNLAGSTYVRIRG